MLTKASPRRHIVESLNVIIAPAKGDCLIYSDIAERQFQELQVLLVTEDRKNVSKDTLCFTTASNLIDMKGSNGLHVTQTLIETKPEPSLFTYEHVASERNVS